MAPGERSGSRGRHDHSRRARILVVDDDAGMLHSVQRVLGPLYHVECFELPSRALAAAAELRPDVAILDVRMPEMDGFALLAALRRLVPGLDAIFVTGSVQESDHQLVRAVRDQAFYFLTKPFEREVLLTLLERCLASRDLQERNARHRARMERELSAARVFQQSLWPAPEAVVGGLRVSGRSLPSAEVSGDFFDYRDTPRGPMVLLADVSGHGVAAAMITAIVKSAFHRATERGGPIEVVAEIHEALQPLPRRRFATAWCGRFDRAAQRLEFVNAGHPPALVARAGADLEELAATGPIVMADYPGESRWLLESAAFGSGDRLLVYSDGASECSGAGDIAFGPARVAASLDSGGFGGPLLDGLLAELEAHRAGRPQEDDITLLSARWES